VCRCFKYLIAASESAPGCQRKRKISSAADPRTPGARGCEQTDTREHAEDETAY
jgi:hypothetical protein